jgi:hypothetical protein
MTASYPRASVPRHDARSGGAGETPASTRDRLAVRQVEDERLEEVVQNGAYPQATQAVLKNARRPVVDDEKLVVSRRHERGAGR